MHFCHLDICFKAEAIYLQGDGWRYICFPLWSRTKAATIPQFHPEYMRNPKRIFLTKVSFPLQSVLERHFISAFAAA